MHKSLLNQGYGFTTGCYLFVRHLCLQCVIRRKYSLRLLTESHGMYLIIGAIEHIPSNHRIMIKNNLKGLIPYQGFILIEGTSPNLNTLAFPLNIKSQQYTNQIRTNLAFRYSDKCLRIKEIKLYKSYIIDFTQNSTNTLNSSPVLNRNGDDQSE